MSSKFVAGKPLITHTRLCGHVATIKRFLSEDERKKEERKERSINLSNKMSASCLKNGVLYHGFTDILHNGLLSTCSHDWAVCIEVQHFIMQ